METLARLPRRSSNEIMTSKSLTDKLFAPEDSVHSFQQLVSGVSLDHVS